MALGLKVSLVPMDWKFPFKFFPQWASNQWCSSGVMGNIKTEVGELSITFQGSVADTVTMSDLDREPP